MSAATKAEARDIIRRDKLKKLTARQEYAYFQSGTNRLGDPATMYPTPDNEEIDSQMKLALAHINRECRLGFANDITYAVAAQTAGGPLRIPLSAIPDANGELGEISRIYRLYFEDGTGATMRLLPTSRSELDAGGGVYNWQEQSPAAPSALLASSYWIEGGYLNILPAPSSAGTLHFLAGTGLALVGDLAILEAIPSDYHDIVWNCTAWFLARNVPKDAEMMMIAAAMEKETERGVAQILELKRDASAEEENALTVAPTERGGYRSRRRMPNPYYQNWTG